MANATITQKAWVAVRTNGSFEFVDWQTLRPEREDCRSECQWILDNRREWHDANPVQRIEQVDVTFSGSLKQATKKDRTPHYCEDDESRLLCCGVKQDDIGRYIPCACACHHRDETGKFAVKIYDRGSIAPKAQTFVGTRHHAEFLVEQEHLKGNDAFVWQVS